MQEVSGSTPLSSTIEGPAGNRGAFVHFGIDSGQTGSSRTEISFGRIH